MKDICKYYFIGSYIFDGPKVYTEYRDVYIFGRKCDEYRKSIKSDREIGMEFFVGDRKNVKIFVDDKYDSSIFSEYWISIFTDLKSQIHDCYSIKKIKGKCVIKRENDDVNIYIYHTSL